MNILSAIGSLGKDAEIKYTANGDAVASFSFALNSGYGERQITSWLNCNIWGKRAETLAPMILKGTKVGITGELTNRPYKAKDGTEKYSLEVRINDVTLLGAKQTGGKNDAMREPLPNAMSEEFDESIPF